MSAPIYLIVTSYFPTPSSWRCAFVLDQAKAIQKTGRYEVVVVNVNHDGDYEYDGIRVYGMMGMHAGSFLCPPVYDSLNFGRFRAALQRGRIDIGRIAVVHAHLITTACYGVRLKRLGRNMTCLVQLHDADPLFTIVAEPKWDVLNIKRYLYYRHHRKLLESVDAAVAISRQVDRVAREFPRQSVLNGYPPMRKSMHALRFCRSPRQTRFILLHNGVNTDLFCPGDRVAKQDRGDGNGLTIGCIGNFTDIKDQITLIKAVERLNGESPAVVGHLVFVGSGPLLRACKAYVADHGLSDVVEFATEVRHEALPDFYRSLDLFVLPSCFEGFGCVFTEAWSCGVPFITCEGQGIEDIIFPEDRHLWFCRQHDHEDLAEKIKYFVENRPVQRLCGEIDIDKLVPRFLDEVESLRVCR